MSARYLEVQFLKLPFIDTAIGQTINVGLGSLAEEFDAATRSQSGE